MKKVFLIPVLLLLGFSSCQKAGTGGEAILNVHILREGGVGTVPGSQVYLKYNSEDYPGPNTGLYDENVLADYGGHAQFINLRRGQYYIYVRGVDTLNPDTLAGGAPFKLEERVGERHVVIEVR